MILKSRIKLHQLKSELKKMADPKRAEAWLWFFRTGKGQYGEGDKFLGVKGADRRKAAKRFSSLSLGELDQLLKSDFHEERQVLYLFQFGNLKEGMKKSVKPFINFIYYMLYKLAKSKNLWERRIAIISTMYFIGKNQFTDSLRLARILLRDKQDLIHKAVGWMVREVGKRDKAMLEKFLQTHIKAMPRTALRYAIEKFSPEERRRYLNL